MPNAKRERGPFPSLTLKIVRSDCGYEVRPLAVSSKSSASMMSLKHSSSSRTHGWVEKSSRNANAKKTMNVVTITRNPAMSLTFWTSTLMSQSI